jgi:hypothetical protein
MSDKCNEVAPKPPGGWPSQLEVTAFQHNVTAFHRSVPTPVPEGNTFHSSSVSGASTSGSEARSGGGGRPASDRNAPASTRSARVTVSMFEVPDRTENLPSGSREAVSVKLSAEPTSSSTRIPPRSFFDEPPPLSVKRRGLTGVATTPGPTPRDSAAAAGSAACTTAPAAAAAAASATAATAPPSESFAHLRFCDVFFVEDIERRQAHVGNLLLPENDFMGRREILRLDVRCWSAGRCRCCARQRK